MLSRVRNLFRVGFIDEIYQSKIMPTLTDVHNNKLKSGVKGTETKKRAFLDKYICFTLVPTLQRGNVFANEKWFSAI